MSVGRILTQGFGSFGGRKYLPTMGLGSFVDNAAVVTTRLALIGTSRQRLSIEGTSAERLATVGTSQKRLTIEGASR